MNVAHMYLKADLLRRCRSLGVKLMDLPPKFILNQVVLGNASLAVVRHTDKSVRLGVFAPGYRWHELLDDLGLDS